MDLDDQLRREFASERYQLPLDQATVLRGVEERMSGGRAWRRRAAMAGSAIAVAGVGIAIGTAAVLGGSTPGPVEPASSASAPSEAVEFSGDVRAVPPGLVRAPSTSAAAETGTALRALPAGGDRAGYVATPDPGRLWRLVVVRDGQDTGLPGTVVAMPTEWASGGQVLITDDGTSTYLVAYEPSGRRWFFAVTGATPADRLAALRPLLQENVKL